MNRKKQFTLIELIIVIIVIGLLSAMSLLKVTGVVKDARISAMINDKETLEKTMILYHQKYDSFPLLNDDQELIALSNNSFLKLVKAEDFINEDMKDVYSSLKETLEYYEDSEENIYRIDVSKINELLDKKLKYGTKKDKGDFYVYSTKTNNVYYYSPMTNSKGAIQHAEYEVLTKEVDVVKKKPSIEIDEEAIPLNRPIVELKSNLDTIIDTTEISWEYELLNENVEIAQMCLFLNDAEYNSIEEVPTKLKQGDYTLKFKVQNTRGIWSREIVKEFSVKKGSSIGGYQMPDGTIITANRSMGTAPPKNAIDGDINSPWNSGTYSGILTLTFPKATYITKLQVAPDSSPNCVHTYKVRGLRNGKWEDIGSANIMVYHHAFIYTPIQLKAGYYDSIELNINSGSSWTAIHELSLYSD